MYDRLFAKSIVITGVSSGIGRSIAEVFLENGCAVFGSVRRMEDADALLNQYPALFTPLLFDVRDETAIQSASETVKEKLNGKGLDALINNAGIAKGGPLIYMDMELIKKHFEVNVFGVIQVIRAFAPLLGAVENFAHTPGKIINISSSSGKIASPFVGPYVGSKFALEGISASLRRELIRFGIDVVIVGPGVVKTPIWNKAGELKEYQNTPYKDVLEKLKANMWKRIDKGLMPEKIAVKVYEIFLSKHPSTRYAVAPNKFINWTLPRLLPERWLDKIFTKMLGNRPEKAKQM